MYQHKISFSYKLASHSSDLAECTFKTYELIAQYRVNWEVAKMAYVIKLWTTVKVNLTL